MRNGAEALDVVVWNKQYFFFLLYWSACFSFTSQVIEGNQLRDQGEVFAARARRLEKKIP